MAQEMTAEQVQQQQERARLMTIKIALSETANTRGWVYMKQVAQNIVQGALQQSLNVGDEEMSEQYRIKARVAQQIFGEMFTVIDSVLSIGTDSQPEWFSELAPYDQAVIGDENGTQD